MKTRVYTANTYMFFSDYIFYFLLHCVPSVTIKRSIYNLISQSRKESLRPAICYHHILLYLIQEYEAT